LVSYVDRFPNPGESVRGNLFKTGTGGKGANQAVMAARLGGSVKMVGRVGNDIFGDTNIQSIKSHGVDTTHIKISHTASSGTASITVSSDGENAIVVTLGANLELGSQEARNVKDVIASAGLVLCQSEIDQMGNLEAFRIAKEHGVCTLFNAAPGLPDLEMELLKLSDVVVTNENEAEFVTGLSLSSIEEFEEAAKKILELGPRISIITLGPKGALVAQRNKSNGQVQVDKVDVPKVKAVDTTGAGDCFCGALAYFFATNLEGDVLEMVRKSVQIAAISVQRQGTQTSYPSHDELIKLGIL
jgi:ribokinase